MYGMILSCVPVQANREIHDFATVARRVVEQAIGEKLTDEPLDGPNAGKNPAAVALKGNSAALRRDAPEPLSCHRPGGR